MSHAGYYPGGKVMTMKVVFEKEDLTDLQYVFFASYEGSCDEIEALFASVNDICVILLIDEGQV